MTTSYVAWNGETYPWPPPDGWYQASDGRWWAPGSGPTAPNAQPSNQAPQQQAPAQQPGPQSGFQQANPYGQAPGGPGGPAGQGAPPPGLGEQNTVLASPNAQAGAPQGLHNPPGVSGPPGLGGPPNGPVDSGGWQKPPAQSTGGSKTPLIVGGGVLLGLLLLVGGFFALRGGGGDIEAGSSTTTAPFQDPGSTLAPVGTPPPTTAPTTTLPTTTEVATTPAPVATLSDDDKVTEFRRILNANDLSSDRLSDDDIVEFGTTFCIFAVIAQDMGDFAEFRQDAIDESESDLSDAELTLVVNAAVVVFCPEEADRLGLTV